MRTGPPFCVWGRFVQFPGPRTLPRVAPREEPHPTDPGRGCGGTRTGGRMGSAQPGVTRPRPRSAARPRHAPRRPCKCRSARHPPTRTADPAGRRPAATRPNTPDAAAHRVRTLWATINPARVPGRRPRPTRTQAQRGLVPAQCGTCPAGETRECPGPTLGVVTYRVPVRTCVAVTALVPILATVTASTPPAAVHHPLTPHLVAYQLPDDRGEAFALLHATRAHRRDRPVMAPAEAVPERALPAAAPAVQPATAPAGHPATVVPKQVRRQPAAQPPPAGRQLPTAGAGVAGVLRYVRAALGSPYLFGAAGPKAYDCSGLVIAAYASVGIRGLPHLASALAHVGRGVPVSDIAPGDILILEGGGHAAIAIGGGMMIHASRAGQPVKIAAIYQTPMAVRRLIG